LDLLVLLLVGWPGRSFSPFFKRRKTKDVACAIGRMAGLSLFKLLAN
jgi:glycerol-3-phosphate acyltransferase PlsY